MISRRMMFSSATAGPARRAARCVGLLFVALSACGQPSRLDFAMEVEVGGGPAVITENGKPVPFGTDFDIYANEKLLGRGRARIDTALLAVIGRPMARLEDPRGDGAVLAERLRSTFGLDGDVVDARDAIDTAMDLVQLGYPTGGAALRSMATVRRVEWRTPAHELDSFLLLTVQEHGGGDRRGVLIRCRGENGVLLRGWSLETRGDRKGDTLSTLSKGSIQGIELSLPAVTGVGSYEATKDAQRWWIEQFPRGSDLRR